VDMKDKSHKICAFSPKRNVVYLLLIPHPRSEIHTPSVPYAHALTLWHWFRLMSAAFTRNFSGRHSRVESCSSTVKHPCCQGESMTLTQRRCPYCDGKNVAAQRTYTIQCGAPRTMYYCACCERVFSETNNPPLAHWKTPIALVGQVLAALIEGVGINAATRLYGVS
jgi:hypothetical protein